MGDTKAALASELKAFLMHAQEDDLLAAANSQTAAAASPCEPEVSCGVAAQQSAQPVYKDHLTVQFPRAAHAAAQTVQDTAARPAAESAPEVPVMPAPVLTDPVAALAELADVIKTCKRCPLGDTRLNAVPGEGNPHAELMFVGEGPGFDEDHKGRPFIGRAGQLLDKMITAMGLKREDVFIANMVKCHPMVNPSDPESHGNDRAPDAGEIAVCRKYIERQIAAICPKYVVALGGVSAKALISDTKSLGALRGKFHDLRLDSVELPRPVKILATYHPAALLRNPGWKKDAWADLQMVMAEMGLSSPK